MSRKNKMYKRSHIRGRKRQEPKGDKLTRREAFLEFIEQQSEKAAFIGVPAKS